MAELLRNTEDYTDKLKVKKGCAKKLNTKQANTKCIELELLLIKLLKLLFVRTHPKV